MPCLKCKVSIIKSFTIQDSIIDFHDISEYNQFNEFFFVDRQTQVMTHSNNIITIIFYTDIKYNRVKLCTQKDINNIIYIIKNIINYIKLYVITTYFTQILI